MRAARLCTPETLFRWDFVHCSRPTLYKPPPKRPLQCTKFRETELEQLGADPAQAALERLWDTNRQQIPEEQVSRITVRDRDFERTPSMKIVRHKL